MATCATWVKQKHSNQDLSVGTLAPDSSIFSPAISLAKTENNYVYQPSFKRGFKAIKFLNQKINSFYIALVTAILALAATTKWDIENNRYFTSTKYMIWEF